MMNQAAASKAAGEKKAGKPVNRGPVKRPRKTKNVSSSKGSQLSSAFVDDFGGVKYNHR